MRQEIGLATRVVLSSIALVFAVTVSGAQPDALHAWQGPTPLCWKRGSTDTCSRPARASTSWHLSDPAALRYRHTVLEPGGSMPGNDLVKKFLGRAQGYDAFERWLNEEFAASPAR